MQDIWTDLLKRNYKDRFLANRLGIFLFVAIVMNVLQTIALTGLMPLKERIPYFVVARQDTGQVSVSTDEAQKFVPSALNIKYFAAKFIRELLTIDPYRTKSELLPAARMMVLSKGKAQFNQFLQADHVLERMDRDPSLVRQVQIRHIVILPGAPNVVSADVKLVTLSSTAAPVTVTKTVTLHYALMPVSDENQALTDPIGFYVTQFEIDEELGQ